MCKTYTPRTRSFHPLAIPTKFIPCLNRGEISAIHSIYSLFPSKTFSALLRRPFHERGTSPSAPCSRCVPLPKPLATVNWNLKNRFFSRPKSACPFGGMVPSLSAVRVKQLIGILRELVSWFVLSFRYSFTNERVYRENDGLSRVKHIIPSERAHGSYSICLQLGSGSGSSSGFDEKRVRLRRWVVVNPPPAVYPEKPEFVRP